MASTLPSWLLVASQTDVCLSLLTTNYNLLTIINIGTKASKLPTNGQLQTKANVIAILVNNNH